ncbi:MAG: TlpA family protein disulfide reductase [Planctomycetes bacterium]|nr:TlpA family protein disulfide reductase [Planctomycetota bacterium]
MLRIFIFTVSTILVVFSGYVFAQNNEESENAEKTDKEIQKKNETKAFNELQVMTKKALTETLTSDERNVLIDLIDKKSHEYYLKFGWLDVKRTKNAIMYRVNVLIYKNRKEEFLTFSKLLLADEKLPDDLRAIIFQERVKNLLALKKYEILLAEIDKLIEKNKDADTNTKRIDLLSYQNMKLYCYLNLKKDMKDVKNIIAKIHANVDKLENESYKFEVIMYVIDILFDFEKYDTALGLITKCLEKIKDINDDESRYKRVRALFTKGKILVMKNKPGEEIKENKLNMEDIAKDISSYRMRYRANMYIKDLDAFIRFRPGIIAPNWELLSLDGKTTVNLRQYKGKIIVIGFWASWNAASRAIMNEYLDKWHTKYKDKEVVVISIGIREHGESAVKQKEYVDENGYKWIFAFDKDGKVAESYGAQEIPQTVLIGKDGIVVVVGQKMSTIQSFLEDNIKKESEKEQNKLQSKPSK